MNSYIVVMTTTDTEDAARNLSKSLVRDRLVACAQRTQIQSTFSWDGEIQDDSEFLVLLKTTKDLEEKLVAAILERHSYDEPEVVVLPVAGGSPGYLGWVDQVTG